MPLVEAMLGEQLRTFDLIVHRALAVGTQLGTDEPRLQADERMVWIVRRRVLRDARERPEGDLRVVAPTAFGASWLAASRTLPYLSNPNERFRITEGRALEDGGPP